jgi:carbon monoxide dehydrogenase subunit G
MAHYATKVHTSLPAPEAFELIADFRNLAQWDPGVISSVQTSGDGVELGATYDVEVPIGRGTSILTYEITHVTPSRLLRVVGEHRRFRSVDVIEVEPTADGSIITYDATLTLKGALSFANRLLDRPFRRIGDAAADGLAKAVEGAILVP